MSLHKRRRVVPLVFFILLLTLPALLFIYYTCPCTSTTTASSPSITLLQTPTPNFTFTIKLLAYDRIDSVSRCLRSLANADYGNDRVNLHVFIDHFKQIANSSGADVDKKLEESHRILNFVNGFAWGFGDKLVHYRTGNVGLQAQWLEAWWPSSDDDFAFVVEDDLEISPLFYRFLRGLIDNYYYNSSNYSPFVYGASLQRPRFVPGKHGNKLQLDSETRLFMYQLVGTWGQLLFPKPWKEFRIWYDTHKEKGIKPILQGMVTTGWYKKMGERIWTPWFIKFIHSRGYFNIYTNFLRERALSVSHRDAGVNYGKTAGPDSKLLDEISLDFKLLEMPALSNLKWYDFCFREVLPGRIVTNFDELGSVLYSVQKHKTVILVSLFEATHIVIKNMLCHFERLDIQNYILVGPRSDFLFDLARRGHPVIDADQLLNSIKGHRLKGFQESQHELIKETMVEAYVIKMCVETKHNVWVIDGNVLLTSNDTFSEVDDLSCDISATKDSKLLFVRSSSTTAKVWDDEFIEKVATRTSSFISENSLSKDDQNFRYIVGKTIEEIGTSIRRFDELSFGSNIGMSTGDGKKMVFWPMEMNLDKIQKRLTDLGMWAVDGEGSCMAVICHQS